MNLDAIDYLLCNFAGGADIEEFDDFSFDFSSNEKFFFKELKVLLYKKPL